jgi:transcriptional regulator with XRE-family HTH domain
MSSTQHDTDLDALRAHFGLELRRLCRRAGLSMNQLAKALGCTPQWIHQLEKAGKPVPEQMAFDLDTYFKTDGWEEDDGLFHRLYAAIRRAGRRHALRLGFESYIAQEVKAIGIRCLAAQIRAPAPGRWREGHGRPDRPPDRLGAVTPYTGTDHAL